MHFDKYKSTYTTKNAQEVAEELKAIYIDEHMKIISLDIKIYMLIYQYKVFSIPPNSG